MNTQNLRTLVVGTQRTLQRTTQRTTQQTVQGLSRRLRIGQRIGLLRTFVFALLIGALWVAPVSAAVIEVNLSSPEARQYMHQAVEDLVPALKSPVDDVFGNSLQTLINTGRISQSEAAMYHKIFVKGEAPANQPEIAYLLGLPPEQQTPYVLQRLVEENALSPQEAQFFQSMLNAPDEDVPDMVKAALGNENFGPFATAVLQLITGLTAIDISNGLETCEANASSLRPAGWLGDALKWLGGLAKAVGGGALLGGLIGLITGGWMGGLRGALVGGIQAGAEYVQGTTGSGFMAGPNGEDCSGWPTSFPF